MKARGGSEPVRVSALGVIYMLVRRSSGVSSKLPCTMFNFEMSVNRIPVANARLSAGHDIVGFQSHNPNARMSELLNLVGLRESDGTIECEFYEEGRQSGASFGRRINRIGHNDTMIFKGYISGAQMVMDTAGKGDVGVVVTCVGTAGRLLACPMGSYVESGMNGLMQRLTLQSGLSFNAASNSKIRFGTELGNLNAEVALFLGSGGKSRSVVEMVAFAVHVVRQSNINDMSKDLAEGSKQDEDVLRALGGTTTLNKQLFNDGGLKYVTGLISDLTIALAQGGGSSIMDTLIARLSSDDYLIQLIPRWSCDEEDDFRMELCPAIEEVGHERKTVKLDSSVTRGTTVNLGSMMRLNNPDVVVVASDPMAEFMVERSGPFPLQGAAATDPRIGALVRRMIRQTGAAATSNRIINPNKGLDKSVGLIKFREFQMPDWMACTVLNHRAVDQKSRDNSTKASAERMPAKVKDEKPRTAEAQVAPTSYLYDLADAYAEYILLTRYMGADVAVVRLDPELRFGHTDGIFLENSLGDTIEIDLTDLSTDSGHRMVLVGTLESVSYNYSTSATKSAVGYSIAISRARIRDRYNRGRTDFGKLSVKNPLYVRQSKGSTNNG